jgi:hypothetical protein
MFKILAIAGLALAVTAGSAAAQCNCSGGGHSDGGIWINNGLSTNGIRWNGLSTNGFKWNGVNTNGFRFNGLSTNGYKWNGVGMNGTSINHGWQVIAVELPEVR